MSDPPDAEKPSIHPFVQFMDHMAEHGFEDHEVDVVMAPFNYREVHSIRGDKFDSPDAWASAIQDAQRREQDWAGKLSKELGFPDTSEMSPRDAHMARIVHLMTKYPQADWELLLTGQEDAMDRKPPPRPEPVPVTVQYIEKQKTRFTALRRQRDELVGNGDTENMLTGVLRSYMRVKGFLERHGVDTAALSPSAPVLQKTETTEAKEVQTVAVTHIPLAGSVRDIPEETDTMTAREVSQRIGLTYQTTIRCLSAGSLPYGKKVNRSWVVAKKPFLAWLNSNEDTVRSMTAQTGSKPGRKPAPAPQVPPSSTRGRMPSF